jgi:hypothetical protein
MQCNGWGKVSQARERGSAIAVHWASVLFSTARLQEALMNLKALRSAATLSFSVALAGAIYAQGTPTTQPPAPRQGAPSTDGQTVTVTGCLVKASDLPGASASAASATDFALANVQMRSTSPGGTAGATASGTAPSGTAPGAAAATGPRGMNLKLTGSESDKFSEHVNKQVEVTGKMSMSGAGSGAAGAGTTAAPGTTPGAPGTTGAAAAATRAAGQMGQLQVQSIRATGQSCTASGQ